MDARIAPEGTLEILSRMEMSQLRGTRDRELYELWRRCSLAVLNSAAEEDDVRRILQRNRDFKLTVVQRRGGIELELKKAPESAFVDGQMIRGIREQLFAVLRDIVYTHDDIISSARFDLTRSEGVTDAVFHILRNARVLQADAEPTLVVCWGGHAVSRTEYDYAKSVGYQLGLRCLDVCTGCGAGAMKGPMKGAALGHAKQRIRTGRYLGLTEPTIIAAESPNPIVNELVIMPDMEKRLEAFVRVAHAIIVFPGGVGTAEEILYLLGILSTPGNADVELPLIFTGPKSSEPYFRRLHEFIGETLGESAQARYKLIIDDGEAVAREVYASMEAVRKARSHSHDAYFFNWLVQIPFDFQQHFEATHESMAALRLDKEQPVHSLAVNLRRAFSGIVAGNVREEGIRLVDRYGPFELRGDDSILCALDQLLRDFVTQRRMKLSDPAGYVPPYRLAV